MASDEVAFRDAAHGALVWAASIVIGTILLGMLALGATNLTTEAAMSRVVDDLFRTEKQLDETVRPTREEAQRLIGSTGAIALSETDQTYLAGLVARSTGLPAAEAAQRVKDVLLQARSTAETARKAGIVAAFFAAATLLMGLAVAWFAARKGGEARDKISQRLRH